MLEDMPLRLFTEWQHYFDLEPFGERRADWRHARDLAQRANQQRDAKKPAYPVTDFVPNFDAPTGRDAVPAATKAEVIRAQLKAITVQHNADRAPRVATPRRKKVPHGH